MANNNNVNVSVDILGANGKRALPPLSSSSFPSPFCRGGGVECYVPEENNVSLLMFPETSVKEPFM